MIDQTLLADTLQNVFGHKSFQLHQEKIIHSILSGRDTLAIMPTGGGKSLCYQLPALVAQGVCVVISPLISLMEDQVMDLKQNGISGAYLNSTLSYKEKCNIEARLLEGELKLLYLAPEALQSSFVENILDQIDISLFAIDEAHCVSQWGHEFRKDYRLIGEVTSLYKNVPTIALTATADEKTRRDICHQLRLKDPNIFVSSFDRPNIRYMLEERKNEIKQLDQFIKDSHPEETGIVYCLSRKKVEQVTEQLQKLGHNAFAYHAGIDPKKRSKVHRKFTTEECIIIVATIAFGMGIDRPDVRFVAHLDLPKSIEGYYQETGRAGRDGRDSNAWLLYGLQDVVKLSRMLEMTDADESYKKIARFKLDAMLGLCEITHCRRTYLLNYFGEMAKSCGNCDTCLNPPEMIDATVDAQKLLSTIFKTGQSFGAGHVIDVLRGGQTAKILERGHDKLTVFGIGKNISKSTWDSMMRQLLNLGIIFIKNWDYRTLALSQKSAAVLRGDEKVFLRKQELKILTPLEKKKKRTVKNHGPQTAELTDLYEHLRAIRKNLSKEQGVPPYIIFSDKSLQDMANIRPRNRDEFLMVHGVGEAKAQKYGEIFIKEISPFLS